MKQEQEGQRTRSVEQFSFGLFGEYFERKGGRRSCARMMSDRSNSKGACETRQDIATQRARRNARFEGLPASRSDLADVADAFLHDGSIII